MPYIRWGCAYHQPPTLGAGSPGLLVSVWMQLAPQKLRMGQDMRLHCTKLGLFYQAHLHLVWVQLALQKVRLRLHISLQHLRETVPLGAALLEGSLNKCGSCKAEGMLSGVAISCLRRTE